MNPEIILRAAKSAGRVGLAVLVMNTTACGPSERTSEPNPSSPQAIYKVYPELEDISLSAKERRSISSKIPTYIINYTQFSINPEAFTELYRVIDFYADAFDTFKSPV